jgi:hypothetical protein
MPFKNPEKKRAYMKEYMARKRADVRPSISQELEPVRPYKEPSPFP